jgi:hypothetical protein
MRFHNAKFSPASPFLSLHPPQVDTFPKCLVTEQNLAVKRPPRSSALYKITPRRVYISFNLLPYTISTSNISVISTSEVCTGAMFVWLRVKAKLRVRAPVTVRFVSTPRRPVLELWVSSGTHPASCPMCTRDIFPTVKAARA